MPLISRVKGIAFPLEWGFARAKDMRNSSPNQLLTSLLRGLPRVADENGNFVERILSRSAS